MRHHPVPLGWYIVNWIRYHLINFPDPILLLVLIPSSSAATSKSTIYFSWNCNEFHLPWSNVTCLSSILCTWFEPHRTDASLKCMPSVDYSRLISSIPLCASRVTLDQLISEQSLVSVTSCSWNRAIRCKKRAVLTLEMTNLPVNRPYHWSSQLTWCRHDGLLCNKNTHSYLNYCLELIPLLTSSFLRNHHVPLKRE